MWLRWKRILTSLTCVIGISAIRISPSPIKITSIKFACNRRGNPGLPRMSRVGSAGLWSQPLQRRSCAPPQTPKCYILQPPNASCRLVTRVPRDVGIRVNRENGAAHATVSAGQVSPRTTWVVHLQRLGRFPSNSGLFGQQRTSRRLLPIKEVLRLVFDGCGSLILLATGASRIFQERECALLTSRSQEPLAKITMSMTSCPSHSGLSLLLGLGHPRDRHSPEQ